MNDKVKEQILKVRDTGKTNMLDTCKVQRIGLDMRLYEMVIFIEENKAEYVNFILHGDGKEKSRFRNDYATVMEGDEDAERIILRRKEEITGLRREGRQCRNGFRIQCIRQELERLEHELEILVDLL
jgi:hypothetical protein